VSALIRRWVKRAKYWKPVSGRGHVYSYEVVHHAIQPGFKEWTPYSVVLIELDEQRGAPTPDEALRVIANLVTPEFRPEPELVSLFAKRTTAIGRWNVRQKEVRHPLVGVDLILHARESVAFVLINLVIDCAAALLDSVDDLLRF